MELRGAAIAEGDVLVLALRRRLPSQTPTWLLIYVAGLAPELLLRRYTIPASQNPNNLLSQHEQGLLEEMTSILQDSGEHHRGDFFNRMLLPRSLPLVEAIGHRMALEAAIRSGVPEPLVRLYEIGAVGTDIGWYVEKRLLTRNEYLTREDAALSPVYSNLDEYLDMMNIAPYAVAAIASDVSWQKFADSLRVYSGDAVYNPLSSEFQPTARL